MNEEQVEALNRIASRVAILRSVVITLCQRQGLTEGEVRRISGIVRDTVTVGVDPNAVKILEEELDSFWEAFRLPIMGKD